MEKKYIGMLSLGEITLKTYGSGNGQVLVIRCEGASFDDYDFRKIENGFELDITGEWEAFELKNALKHFLEKSNIITVNSF